MTLPLDYSDRDQTEIVIWNNEVVKGIFNKKVVETQIITNLRVIQNNDYVTLENLDDVIIMNQHRISNSEFMGTLSRGHYRVGYGQGSSRSRSIGDVVFISNNIPVIVFRQIIFPRGLVSLVKSLRKTKLNEIKKNEMIRTELLKEESRYLQRQGRQERKKLAEIKCLNCESQNPANANFCNFCGNKLTKLAKSVIRCSNCGTENDVISDHCNGCGVQYLENNGMISSTIPLRSYKSTSQGFKINLPSHWNTTESMTEENIIIVSKSQNTKDLFSDTIAVTF